MTDPRAPSFRALRAAILACLCWVAPALAQPAPDADAARRAYDEGRVLFDARRFAEACPKLEESLRYAQDLRTQYGLADCYEKLGRLASAWRQFNAVADSAGAAGNAEQQQFALDRARTLLPRLTRLTVSVVPQSSSLEGFEVLQDRVRVEPNDWGQAVPVDPGAHRVEAVAKGYRRWWRDVDTSAEGMTLTVEVPPLEPIVPKNRPPSPVLPRPHSPPKQAPPAPDPGSAQRVLGITVGAVGLATLAAGVITGLLAKDRFSDSDVHCRNGFCDDEGLAIRDQAYDRGNVATILSIAGGAVAAGGVVLFLTAPSGRNPDAAPRVGLQASASGAKVRLWW